MTHNRTRIIATIIVSSLFAASTAAADNENAVAKTIAAPTDDTAKRNRNLAESVNTASVEDAIEAVLAANKLDLEVRFIGPTSVKIADGR